MIERCYDIPVVYISRQSWNGSISILQQIPSCAKCHIFKNKCQDSFIDIVHLGKCRFQEFALNNNFVACCVPGITYR